METKLMFKKNFLCFAIFTAAIFFFGCASPFSIDKESQSAPKLNVYKNIYIGWLDLREDDWKLYGYTSKNLWLAEIKRHNVTGLQQYIKAELPGKKISGASSKTEKYSGKGKSDLLMKFKLNKLEAEAGMTSLDRLYVDVDFIDGKSGKKLYTASLVSSSAAAFPRNWKASSFDGRLDNEIYNLSRGIAEKLK
jgi:hypothetical protein